MTEPSAHPIVSVRDLRKSFGTTPVLKGVSFDVAKGEVICIIGPSGSGKSTILRCINGLVPIDSGSIRVADFDVHTLRTDREMIALRKEVSIVFQQYNLYPHKTALANVMMAPVHVLKEDPREVEARARQLLTKVRLAEKADSYPGELSGGQQQRVAIARALAMRPGDHPRTGRGGHDLHPRHPRNGLRPRGGRPHVLHRWRRHRGARAAPSLL